MVGMIHRHPLLQQIEFYPMNRAYECSNPKNESNPKKSGFDVKIFQINSTRTCIVQKEKEI